MARWHKSSTARETHRCQPRVKSSAASSSSSARGMAKRDQGAARSQRLCRDAGASQRQDNACGRGLEPRRGNPPAPGGITLDTHVPRLWACYSRPYVEALYTWMPFMKYAEGAEAHSSEWISMVHVLCVFHKNTGLMPPWLYRVQEVDECLAVCGAGAGVSAGWGSVGRVLQAPAWVGSGSGWCLVFGRYAPTFKRAPDSGGVHCVQRLGGLPCGCGRRLGSFSRKCLWRPDHNVEIMQVRVGMGAAVLGTPRGDLRAPSPMHRGQAGKATVVAQQVARQNLFCTHAFPPA